MLNAGQAAKETDTTGELPPSSRKRDDTSLEEGGFWRVLCSKVVPGRNLCPLPLVPI